MIVAVILAQIQAAEALSGSSGWMGAGLLGLVLGWLLLKHLPSKDEQIKDLLQVQDAQIEKLTNKYTAALDKAVADHKAALDKVVADHKQMITTVINQASAESEAIRAERAEMMRVMVAEREMDRKARHASADQNHEGLLMVLRTLAPNCADAVVEAVKKKGQ